MNSINLGGHSGCHILLLENDEGNVFVRKISKNVDYNSRLKTQCEKQSKYNGGHIKTPKVLSTGVTEDGLFYFDMEYIQGITLAEYMRKIEIGKIRGLVNTLVESICVDFSTKTTETNLLFEKKIQELKTKLVGKSSVVDEAIDLLEKHDWSMFHVSFCHGDMTLENIIVKNDELYFIDFLDSFYDSYMIDFGTLLQDIQVMWSYRMDKTPDMNLMIRLIVFRDIFIDIIRKKEEYLVKEVYFSLLLKLIRILPYAEDKLTRDFLTQKIELINKEVV